MASEKYVNNAVTTLNGAINNSTTTVVVTSATTFPTTGNFRIAVAGEIMLVTSVSSNTFTVTRGAEGSTAASHADLTPVTHVLTKGSLDAILADNCQYGTCANLPAAERAGRIYFGSDFPMVYRDNGSTWQAYYRNAPATPPVTSGYTWTHGGATATNTDVTNGPSYITVQSTGSGDKLSTFLKNLPGTPCSVIARIICMQVNSQTAFACIGMSDGTKVDLIGWIYESVVPRLWTGRYNSLTSFAGEITGRMEPGVCNADAWLKITDDGTNRLYGYSNDGVNYTTVASISRTNFLTATKGGIVIGTNAVAGQNSNMLWVSDGQ